MKSTIKDVARLAGVSFKTVSRVINNERNVKAETVEKVRQAIDTLEYQPNQAARNLAGLQTYAVGYVYDNPNAYYVIDMQEGILSACHQRGYELMILPCHASAPNILTSLSDLIKRSKLAGLVLSPPLSERSDVLLHLDKMGIPVVAVVSGDDAKGPCPVSVRIQDKEAAAAIVNHLVHQGHKRIGFISGDQAHGSTHQREIGYREALAKAGIPVDDTLSINGSYSFDSGVEGFKQLMSLPEPPTALFACNDEIASGALFQARIQGLEVPADIAIAGFENSPFSRQTWPRLTTATQPIRTIAEEAGSLLIDVIQAKRADSKSIQSPISRTFTPSLIIRESTSLQEQG